MGTDGATISETDIQVCICNTVWWTRFNVIIFVPSQDHNIIQMITKAPQKIQDEG
jgi:hypothetical protein